MKFIMFNRQLVNISLNYNSKIQLATIKNQSFYYSTVSYTTDLIIFAHAVQTYENF